MQNKTIQILFCKRWYYVEPPLDRYVGPTWSHHVGPTLIPRAKLRWADRCGLPTLDQRSKYGPSTLCPRRTNISMHLGKFMTTHQKFSVCTLESSVFLFRIFHENDQIPGERIDRIHYNFV